jgi:hypothetical protein
MRCRIRQLRKTSSRSFTRMFHSLFCRRPRLWLQGRRYLVWELLSHQSAPCAPVLTQESRSTSAKTSDTLNGLAPKVRSFQVFRRREGLASQRGMCARTDLELNTLWQCGQPYALRPEPGRYGTAGWRVNSLTRNLSRAISANCARVPDCSILGSL